MNSVDNGVVDMTLDSSGNITTLDIAGVATPFAQLRRLNGSNGDFDLTFGTNGQFLVTGVHAPTRLAVQSDGKSLVTGTLNNPDGIEAVARLGPPPAIFLASNGTLTITGTAGADTISVSLVQSGTKISAFLNGASQSFDAARVLRVDISTGAGNDSITVSPDLTSTGGQPSTIDAGAGTDTVQLGNVPAAVAASGFLTVRAGNGGQTVQDTAGRLDLVLGDGNNVVQAGPQADTLVTGAGDDQIVAGAGNDSVDAGDGNNAVRGGDGTDTLTGGSGVDVLAGNGGADTLLGGAGNDVLYGGTNPVGAAPDFDANDAGDSLYGGDGDDLLFGGGGKDSASGGAQKDLIYGGAGADLLAGNGGKDKMSGDGGNDRLYGGASRDQMVGGAANDRLFGQGGNDALFSGSGTDALNGGPGFDYLAGKPGDTHDDDSRDTLVGF
jgi:Ca2+-binding RTX toxin-like protein